MESHEFAVVGSQKSDYVACAYSEFERMTDVYVVRPLGGWLGRARRVTQSFRLRTVIPAACQEVWPRHDLGRLAGCRHPRYFLLMDSPDALNPVYVKYVRKHFPNSALCLYMLNTVDENNLTRVHRVLSYYDLVLTCNSDDAEKMGWLYHRASYSEPVFLPSVSAEVDVCFVASDKGRGDLAWMMYNRLRDLGRRCDFLLIGPEDRSRARSDFRYSGSMLSYSEYLRRIRRAKAILEIVASNQDYCTLRTMEALSYGKLLLTTNENVTREPFFSRDQIHVIRDVSDLDDVDFDLQLPVSRECLGLFSPRRMLDCIVARLEERRTDEP